MMFHHDGLRTIIAENARAAHIIGHPLLILLSCPFFIHFSDPVSSDRTAALYYFYCLFLAGITIVSISSFTCPGQLMRPQKNIN